MIDIEKFICSLLADHPEGITVRNDIHKALKEQGLEYKDGKIVPIEDKTELKESEDERIRKWLYGYFRSLFATWIHPDITCEEILAWLEKQGETFTKKDVDDAYIEGMAFAKYELEKQKPAWSEEDEEFLRRAINATKDAYPITAKWLKSLKSRVQSKQEWNEEDDLILETIIDHIIPDKPFIANGFTDEELVTWLKSLRPQNRWKPSDEQTKALHDLNLTGNISYAG